MANAWIAFATLELHSEDGTVEFLNDTGVDLEAGYTHSFDDGVDKHIAVLHRRVENGRIGSLHFTHPRSVYLMSYGTAANVAVGALGSIEAATGNWIAGLSGQGRYMALPKQGQTMVGAAAAAASGDTGILVVDVGTT